MNSKANFGKYFAELQECWRVLAGMCGGTIVISIIYIFLLKWITKPLLYISMVVILAMFVLLGGWSWMQKDKYDAESDDYMYAQVGAYVAWGISAVYLCFMCCCWSNISLGASIMEAASDFVSQNLRIILLPIFSYLICLPFIVYWVYTAVYIYSIGEPEFEKNSFIANIKWDDRTNYMIWYFLFGLFWVIAFLICLQQFMIAAMACMWYFSGQGAEMSD